MAPDDRLDSIVVSARAITQRRFENCRNHLTQLRLDRTSVPAKVTDRYYRLERCLQGLKSTHGPTLTREQASEWVRLKLEARFVQVLLPAGEWVHRIALDEYKSSLTELESVMHIVKAVLGEHWNKYIQNLEQVETQIKLVGLGRRPNRLDLSWPHLMQDKARWCSAARAECTVRDRRKVGYKAALARLSAQLQRVDKKARSLPLNSSVRIEYTELCREYDIHARDDANEVSRTKLTRAIRFAYEAESLAYLADLQARHHAMLEHNIGHYVHLAVHGVSAISRRTRIRYGIEGML